MVFSACVCAHVARLNWIEFNEVRAADAVNSKIADRPRSGRCEDVSELEYRVASVLDMLDQAARGVDVAWSLSNVFETVDRLFLKSNSKITARQRDGLLSTHRSCSDGADEYLPQSYRRQQIEKGMKSLAAQVVIWAETPQRTAKRAQHSVTDTRAFARMFRNDLHNISLCEEIDQRARQRRDAEIRRLLKVDGPSNATDA
jgi:hypothetical protein